MRQKRRIGIFIYVFADWLMAVLAWSAVFFFRKFVIEDRSLDEGLHQLLDRKFYYGILIIPLCWLLVYFITGSYSDLYRKSRLAELNKTLLITTLGVIFIFFALILDDYVTSYRDYYQIFLFLFATHFLLTATSRMIILTKSKRQLQRGEVGYNTLLVGANRKALDIYRELNKNKRSMGNKFNGYININGQLNGQLSAYMPHLGELKDLKSIIAERDIEEVVIALESSEHGQLSNIINTLVNRNVVIKIEPDIYDILSGSVKVNNVFGEALIEIYPELMPAWQKKIKRIVDMVVSVIVLLLLWPLFLFIAIRVKLSSPGPVFYSQERVGLHGKDFNIIKFRSMYVDAEKEGPALSSENDSRITGWGKIMRKWRFDELPQFYNILRGDMSLVGPRPERRYYVDQIIELAPSYRHLHKVKPGLTSWGMVKFGYASSVDEMIKRMKYDLLYIENMSLALDLKIMFYTLLIILQGKGK